MYVKLELQLIQQSTSQTGIFAVNGTSHPAFNNFLIVCRRIRFRCNMASDVFQYFVFDQSVLSFFKVYDRKLI